MSDAAGAHSLARARLGRGSGRGPHIRGGREGHSPMKNEKGELRKGGLCASARVSASGRHGVHRGMSLFVSFCTTQTCEREERSQREKCGMWKREQGDRRQESGVRRKEARSIVRNEPTAGWGRCGERQLSTACCLLPSNMQNEANGGLGRSGWGGGGLPIPPSHVVLSAVYIPRGLR
jgi:hypothetical protein